MKIGSRLFVFGAAFILAAAFFVGANRLQVQAQDASIVGTWIIEDEVSDVLNTFHADGTLITVTEFSLTHPDTPQLGIWWQDGDVIYWMARGFTGSGDATMVVNVTGTAQMNGADEITVDPLVEITLPNGSTVVDDGPPQTATRMQPPAAS